MRARVLSNRPYYVTISFSPPSKKRKQAPASPLTPTSPKDPRLHLLHGSSTSTSSSPATPSTPRCKQEARSINYTPLNLAPAIFPSASPSYALNSPKSPTYEPSTPDSNFAAPPEGQQLLIEPAQPRVEPSGIYTRYLPRIHGNTLTNLHPTIAREVLARALIAEVESDAQYQKVANDKDYLHLELSISELRADRSKINKKIRDHLAAQFEIRHHSEHGLTEDLLVALPADEPDHWIVVAGHNTKVWIAAAQRYIVYRPALCPQQVKEAIHSFSNRTGPFTNAQTAAAKEECYIIEARIEKAREIHDSIQDQLSLC